MSRWADEDRIGLFGKTDERLDICTTRVGEHLE